MRLFNRESPRIHANRIFLAFGCSASADACKSKICVPPQMGFAHLGFAYAESHPLWKNAEEKPACGFFLSCMSFFLQKIDEQSLFLIWGAGPRLRRGAARGGISYLLRPLYVACKPSACVPPQMGFAHLGFPGSSSGVKDSDRKYVIIVRIQFGKYIAGCGSMRKPTA